MLYVLLLTVKIMYIIVMLRLSCHLCFQTCLLVIFVNTSLFGNGHSYLCVYMCTKAKTVLPTLSQYRTELGENTFKYATSFSLNNKQKDLKFSIRTVLLVSVTAFNVALVMI